MLVTTPVKANRDWTDIKKINIIWSFFFLGGIIIELTGIFSWKWTGRDSKFKSGRAEVVFPQRGPRDKGLGPMIKCEFDPVGLALNFWEQTQPPQLEAV